MNISGGNLDLAREYARLISRVRLTKREADRLGELLNMAQNDGILSFLFNEVDSMLTESESESEVQKKKKQRSLNGNKTQLEISPENPPGISPMSLRRFFNWLKPLSNEEPETNKNCTFVLEPILTPSGIVDADSDSDNIDVPPSPSGDDLDNITSPDDSQDLDNTDGDSEPDSSDTSENDGEIEGSDSDFVDTSDSDASDIGENDIGEEIPFVEDNEPDSETNTGNNTNSADNLEENSDSDGESVADPSTDSGGEAVVGTDDVDTTDDIEESTEDTVDDYEELTENSEDTSDDSSDETVVDDSNEADDTETDNLDDGESETDSEEGDVEANSLEASADDDSDTIDADTVIDGSETEGDRPANEDSMESSDELETDDLEDSESEDGDEDSMSETSDGEEEIDSNNSPFVVGETGEVTIDFSFDSESFKGELGVFNLEDLNINFDSEESVLAFIQETARRTSSNSEGGHIIISQSSEGEEFFTDVNDREDSNFQKHRNEKTIKLRSGSRFGVLFVPNGKIEDVLENPKLTGTQRPLFSVGSSSFNDDGFYFGKAADVSSERGTFALEDVWSDKNSDATDSNIVFQVRGATGNISYFSRLISTRNDWSNPELEETIASPPQQNSTPEVEEPVGESSEPTDADIEGESETVGEGSTSSTQPDTVSEKEETVPETASESIDPDTGNEPDIVGGSVSTPQSDTVPEGEETVSETASESMNFELENKPETVEEKIASSAQPDTGPEAEDPDRETTPELTDLDPEIGLKEGEETIANIVGKPQQWEAKPIDVSDSFVGISQDAASDAVELEPHISSAMEVATDGIADSQLKAEIEGDEAISVDWQIDDRLEGDGTIASFGALVSLTQNLDADCSEFVLDSFNFSEQNPLWETAIDNEFDIAISDINYSDAIAENISIVSENGIWNLSNEIGWGGANSQLTRSIDSIELDFGGSIEIHTLDNHTNSWNYSRSRSRGQFLGDSVDIEQSPSLQHNILSSTNQAVETSVNLSARSAAGTGDLQDSFASNTVGNNSADDAEYSSVSSEYSGDSGEETSSSRSESSTESTATSEVLENTSATVRNPSESIEKSSVEKVLSEAELDKGAQETMELARVQIHPPNVSPVEENVGASAVAHISQEFAIGNSDIEALKNISPIESFARKLDRIEAALQDSYLYTVRSGTTSNSLVVSTLGSSIVMTSTASGHGGNASSQICSSQENHAYCQIFEAIDSTIASLNEHGVSTPIIAAVLNTMVAIYLAKLVSIPHADSAIGQEINYWSAIEEYMNLSLKSELTDVEAERLTEMLEWASNDARLSVVFSEVDEWLLAEQGFLDEDDRRDYEHIKGQILELLALQQDESDRAALQEAIEHWHKNLPTTEISAIAEELPEGEKDDRIPEETTNSDINPDPVRPPEQSMTTLSIQLPNTLLTEFDGDRDRFVREMRIAAAAKWYEMGTISQEQAAEIANLSRQEFMESLSRYQVDFMQYSPEELGEEMSNVDVD